MIAITERDTVILENHEASWKIFALDRSTKGLDQLLRPCSAGHSMGHKGVEASGIGS